MIRDYAYAIHRRLFSRCQGCGKRLGAYRPRVYGYEWNGWLHSDVGLWHAECLEEQMDFDWNVRGRFKVAK